MRKASFAIVLIVAATFVFYSSAVAQGTYTQFDYPGAQYTVINGINDSGDLVGYYCCDDSGEFQGFLQINNVVKELRFRGATSTVGRDINNSRQVVGFYTDDNGTTGFLYNTTVKTFDKVKYHPGSYSTTPYAINKWGTIVGSWVDVDGIVRGFKRVGYDYASVVPPGSTGDTVATGIATDGTIIGYSDPTAPAIFTYARNEYRDIQVPGAPGATVAKLNAAGTSFVGNFFNGGAFVYQNHAVQALQFPGAMLTVGTGINSVGQVVGFFEDTSGTDHGFIWTP